MLKSVKITNVFDKNDDMTKYEMTIYPTFKFEEKNTFLTVY